MELSKLIASPKADRGDYFDIFHKVHAFFEIYDAFYGIISEGFNIRPSLLAMPNPKQSDAFKTKLIQTTLANLKNQTEGLRLGATGQISLSRIFGELLNLLYYRLLRPAAPPAGHRF